MDLGQLETFLVVAREKSFSRAAERLYRTQPAVSLALKRLEEELGETLLDRTTKGGTLTDAGATLLPLAQRMFDLRKQILDTFGALKGLQQGRLNIGANESVTEFLLPSVLLAYQQAHPAIRIQAYRQSSERIPAEVLERRLDIGFVSYDPMHPELMSEVILRDHMVLVVPPDHRLARRHEISLESLGRETFVAHNAITPTRNAIIDLFARCGTPLRITMELGSLATIQEFVALGAGLAILPRMTVLEAVRRGRLVEVAVKELQVEKLIRIVTRREEAMSHAAKAFLQLIRATDFTHTEAVARRKRT
ncbi:LysR family transcriptional regulator [Geothrix limicola]|uniref:LysR family transcriptional regulator n=1 Tax=Geothrix limicola TaxID=2927978 RepID=A0ABQ5QAU6_9BACT|nr:LysR family transcriptional regulator [Geothrix limicola]GLH71950.1 LysR family transcriptional regulator [Geothrix limicola]